ncbi:HAD family hydrolase [Ornithinibacillus xuwenensis]|uniref:HAD-IA family hydrolase n=1 Tax=Ornithinibacillus xuwenensis TaxID=3144668 RepID=A0ABU9XEP7_9BACI
MIKAVLFDLDGTLLNRDESVRRFIEDQYERFHTNFNHISKETYMSRFLELEHHGYVWKDKVYQQLTLELEINNLSSDFLLEDYMDYFKHHCVPFPNLLHLLEVLKQKNYLLGIITNGIGTFQMNSIEALGMKAYFDLIKISEWEGLRKPNPDIFHHSLKELKILPSEAIYVGDSPVNDVEAAYNIGMIGVWKRHIAYENFATNYTIDDLLELLVLLQELESNN